MNKQITRCFFVLFLFFPVHESYSMLLSECRDIHFVAETADIIIQAEVIKVEVQRSPRGHIYTSIDVKVIKYFKGKDDAVITIKLPGGKLENGEGMWVEDTPSFQVGQIGYLCLKSPQDDQFYLNRFYGSICGQGMLENLPN